MKKMQTVTLFVLVGTWALLAIGAANSNSKSQASRAHGKAAFEAKPDQAVISSDIQENMDAKGEELYTAGFIGLIFE